MVGCYWISLFLSFSCFVGILHASVGDADPSYRSCLKDCEASGCVGDICFPHCNFSSDGASLNGPWYMQEPLYLRWKQWDCHSDCRYHCMLNREKDRAASGHEPVKYHGKWPFKRVFGIQEPASVVFSALNLAMHFHGDVEMTEKLDYFSAIALLGYSLIVAILRSFNVRLEAARVMVSAPLLAFVTTHILYLNNYKLDYGWNMKVCVAMGVAQLLIWAVWGGVSGHPSRWKLWFVIVAGALAMLLEIYDFPPYEGFVDAHAAWHATTIPLTYLWWSFIKDDAEFRTSTAMKKIK
uniref:post-GPI attachment to proteins factor 3 isoform X2 n=1 Tax=Erigeron canadensis TaxID=72917 RepID=UPI001CB93911|nr:post-GPI attachment to proteins factor 3 isoform X2 [Erigeron canadensis]